MFRKIITTIIILMFASRCTPPVSEVPNPQVLPDATPTKESPVLIVNTSVATFTPVPTGTVEFDSDECDNPFYPVSDEATWTYDMTGNGVAVHVMSVDEKGAFTINIQGGDNSFSIEGDCTNEGIVIMNAPGVNTTVSSSDGSAVVSTIDVEGVTIPKDIKINDQWSQTINVTTDGKKSEIFTQYTALGFENISVPAGDFYVLKIEQSGYVTIFGQKINMHGFQWFAEGVGTVKSAMDDAPVAELVSFDIPD